MPVTHFWRVSWTLAPFVCQHATPAPPRRVFIAYSHKHLHVRYLDISAFIYHFRSGMIYCLNGPAGKPFQASSHKTRLDGGPGGLGLNGPGSDRWECCRACGRCHVLLMQDLEENVQTDESWHGVQTCLGLFVPSRCWHVFGECIWKNTRMRCKRGAPRGGE